MLELNVDFLIEKWRTQPHAVPLQANRQKDPTFIQMPGHRKRQSVSLFLGL